MQEPQIAWLPDGRRLHFNHGPIDLIVEAFGEPDEVRAACRQTAVRFQTILTELVGELAELRRPATFGSKRRFDGVTANRMEAAVEPLAEKFITPMATVAGSVADEMMAAMTADRRLDRAYVNNGGDIALQLAPGKTITLAVAGTGSGFAYRILVRYADGIRGIATSGWRGRSFSLGIADAVTVLAKTAAQADAAATIIANAVDLPGHPAILRVPARELSPDSDLGTRLVTQGVGALTVAEIDTALNAGWLVANELRQRGLIQGAALFLAGESRICGAFGGTVETSAMPGSRLFAPPSVLPDISPTRGEISLSRSPCSTKTFGVWSQRTSELISPRVGEMSGRTEGGNVGSKASVRAFDPAVRSA